MALVTSCNKLINYVTLDLRRMGVVKLAKQNQTLRISLTTVR